jgi:hypothetical protein
LEVVERPSGTRGFSVVPRRWVVERTFSWISRNRRMSKDYERKVQTSETLIQVAMIRLLLARLARHLRTSSQPSALGHKPFPMAFGDNFDDAINHLYSGLIVNRVGRHWHAGGPFFSVGQGIVRQIGLSRCGNIEKSTMPSVLSPPVGGFQPTKYSPMLGVITMLPALSPT